MSGRSRRVQHRKVGICVNLYAEHQRLILLVLVIAFFFGSYFSFMNAGVHVLYLPGIDGVWSLEFNFLNIQ